jgi:hypothetical protein
MTPLPPEVSKRLRDTPEISITSAYDICLRLENTLQLAADKGEDVGNKLIYIRILGYLMHHSPTDQGVASVIKEIVSAAHSSELLDVGKWYFDHFIRAGKSPNRLNM